MTNYKPAVILKRIKGRWTRVLAKRLIKEAVSEMETTNQDKEEVAE